MLKNIPLMIVLAASLTACGGGGGGSGKKSSSSVAPSSTPASVAASSEAASSTPASSEAASSAPASSEAASSTPASSEAAVSSVASSSAASNVINVDLASLRANSGSTLTLSTDGATLVATADGQGAVFDVLKPTMLEGSVVEFVVRVSNEFKTSGAGLQIFAQLKEDWSNGEWDCATESSALIADQDVTLSCTIDEADDKLNQSTKDVQVGIQGKLSTPIAGTVIIKSAKITLATQASSSSVASSAPVASSSSSVAATNLSANFESDTVGKVYTGASWAPADLTASVVSIASVTGLPANGASVNVLKVVPTNYNAVPVVELIVPAGKTLADYNVKVDAYLPRSTLGLTEATNNFYKDFMFLAGTTVTSGAKEDNPAYQSKTATEASVDAWTTFTLSVDATKGAALTNTVQVGLGLNRPAGTNDAYYLDNIRLELK